MKNCDKPVGVFDSGLGGVSVLKELVSIMPNEDFIYYGDSLHAPYGIKEKEEIIKRCLEICDFFVSKNVKAIVIACNTATSAAVNILRDIYKGIPIVGMEPALKLAADNKKNNNIVVMATLLTLNEEKFNNLMQKYGDENNIIKMPCPELVKIIENNMLDNTELIDKQIKEYYKNIDLETLDSIVLGCTHFVFYKEHLRSIINKRTNIVDGNNGTARHLKDVLENYNIIKGSIKKGKVTFLNSRNEEKYIELSKRLFMLW